MGALVVTFKRGGRSGTIGICKRNRRSAGLIEPDLCSRGAIVAEQLDTGMVCGAEDEARATVFVDDRQLARDESLLRSHRVLLRIVRCRARDARYGESESDLDEVHALAPMGAGTSRNGVIAPSTGTTAKHH